MLWFHEFKFLHLNGGVSESEQFYINYLLIYTFLTWTLPYCYLLLLIEVSEIFLSKGSLQPMTFGTVFNL